jgi:hypothetical protein
MMCAFDLQPGPQVNALVCPHCRENPMPRWALALTAIGSRFKCSGCGTRIRVAHWVQTTFWLATLVSASFGLMFSAMWRSHVGLLMAAPPILLAIAMIARWAPPTLLKATRSLLQWGCLFVFSGVAHWWMTRTN